MFENIMLVLSFIVVFIWLAFFIGYPIYEKFVGFNFNWSIYALGLSALALVINIMNIIIQLSF